MSVIIDEIYFQELTQMDPLEVCRRCHCQYDDVEKAYIIEVWNEKYCINPERSQIIQIESKPRKIKKELALVILFYLTKSKDIFVNGEWISEKDLPGGVAFFQGPHTVPSYLIASHFGNDIEAFKKRCLELHGEPRDFGDASFEFRIAPHVPVVVLMWRGDQEFDTDVKILFDKTIASHFPLDVIFCLTLEVCLRIIGES